jgi:hypothetical protein
MVTIFVESIKSVIWCLCTEKLLCTQHIGFHEAFSERESSVLIWASGYLDHVKGTETRRNNCYRWIIIKRIPNEFLFRSVFDCRAITECYAIKVTCEFEYMCLGCLSLYITRTWMQIWTPDSDIEYGCGSNLAITLVLNMARNNNNRSRPQYYLGHFNYVYIATISFSGRLLITVLLMKSVSIPLRIGHKVILPATSHCRNSLLSSCGLVTK